MYRGTFGRGNAPCLRPLVGGTMATAPSGIAGGGSALRFGAKNAQSRWDRAFFTRRSVRGIFPAAHVAGKNDLNLSASGGNQEGTPVPSWTFLRTLDGGRRSPSNCLLLTLLPAIRLAAKRHCRRRPAAAAGRGTGAIAPRQSPQSTACFYRRNIFPQDQGSLVQRELARPKAVTEGLSEVDGHQGMISTTSLTYPLQPLTQTLRWRRWSMGLSPHSVGADDHIGPLLGTACGAPRRGQRPCPMPQISVQNLTGRSHTLDTPTRRYVPPASLP